MKKMKLWRRTTEKGFTTENRFAAENRPTAENRSTTEKRSLIKKLVTLMLATLMCLGLAACGESRTLFTIKEDTSLLPKEVAKVQEERILELGTSDDDRIVVRCSSISFNFLVNYMVGEKKDGVMDTLQYEFYTNKEVFDAAKIYYSKKEVKDYFDILEIDENSYLIVVRDNTQPKLTVDEQYDKYSSKLFKDAGFEIIK